MATYKMTTSLPNQHQHHPYFNFVLKMRGSDANGVEVVFTTQCNDAEAPPRFIVQPQISLGSGATVRDLKAAVCNLLTQRPTNPYEDRRSQWQGATWFELQLQTAQAKILTNNFDALRDHFVWRHGTNLSVKWCPERASEALAAMSMSERAVTLGDISSTASAAILSALDEDTRGSTMEEMDTAQLAQSLLQMSTEEAEASLALLSDAKRAQALQELALADPQAAAKAFAGMSLEAQAMAFTRMSPAAQRAVLAVMTPAQQAAAKRAQALQELALADPQAAAKAFAGMSPEAQAMAFTRMSPAAQRAVLAVMTPAQQAAMLVAMSPEDCAGCLEEFWSEFATGGLSIEALKALGLDVDVDLGGASAKVIRLNMDPKTGKRFIDAAEVSRLSLCPVAEPPSSLL